MAPAESNTPATQQAHGTTVVVGLTAMYCVLATSQITFNKYLLREDRFPFPCYLVLLHTSVSNIFALVLYKARPSIFPTLSDPQRWAAIDRKLILTKFLPVAVFATVSIVTSNMAFQHLSVAFLQMMKKANVVLVFGLSLVAALETFSWGKAGILVILLLATSLTIQGEMHFSMQGFAIQATSQLADCSKIVLQAVLLTSVGIRIDSLSYVLLVMPLCFALLASVVCVGTVVGGTHAFPIPSLAHKDWAPMLFLNTCIAFALNVVTPAVIQKVSALGFMLVGIVKDVVIVFGGCFLLGEEISSSQSLGFAIQILCMSVWTMQKNYPAEFESGFLTGLMKVFELAFYGVEKGKKGVPSAVEPDIEAAPKKKLLDSAAVSYGSAPQR